MRFSILRIAGEFATRHSEVANALDARLRPDERTDGAAVALQNVKERIANILNSVRLNIENKRIVEAARALHDGAAAADPAQNRQAML